MKLLRFDFVLHMLFFFLLKFFFFGGGGVISFIYEYMLAFHQVNSSTNCSLLEL